MVVYTPEPKAAQDAPWLRGPPLKKYGSNYMEFR
jgi:hypothetical protein